MGISPNPNPQSLLTRPCAAVSVQFLDMTPFIGTYVYPTPNTAYYTSYLAEKVLKPTGLPA